MLEDLLEKEWWQLPEDEWPSDLEHIAEVLAKNPHKLKLHDAFGEGEAYRALLRRAREGYAELQVLAKETNPLAFWKPSYDQSLMLNAWIWGHGFTVVFAANRIGKTTALIVNALLWIFPNDPNWLMFKGYTDEFGNWVQVLQRPKLPNLRKIAAFYQKFPALCGDAKFCPHPTPFSPSDDPLRSIKADENTRLREDAHITQAHEHEIASMQLLDRWANAKVKSFTPLHEPCYPEAPMTKGGQIWIGCPDFEFAEKNMMPKWKALVPPSQLLGYSTSKGEFTIQSTNQKRTTHEMILKSYDSDDTKWSGDAVHGIMLTEGLPPSIFNEARLRLAEPAFASWDYTPYEARNVGSKVALAFKVYRGEEHLPLHPVVFTKFSARNAPAHVLPPEKLADMIASYGTSPEGVARLDGDFYSSSGLVLSKLNPTTHYLKLSFQDLLRKFPNQLRFFRAMDPGYDHPTTCAWLALSPTNTWFVFRFYSERNRTIAERCTDIIHLSGNLREIQRYGSGSDEYFYREVHPNPTLDGSIRNPSIPFVTTITDYHMFKEDETTRTSYANKYFREGLQVSRSVTLSQEDRAMETDKLLDPISHQFHPHPITGTPPGARLYFLINEPGVADACQKLENLFWERLKSGDNKGQPKDKVPSHGDDELDGIAYGVTSPHKWSNTNTAKSVPPRTYSQFASMQNPDAAPTTALKSNPNTLTPASLQNQTYDLAEERPITYEDQVKYDKNQILMQNSDGSFYAA